MKKRLLLALALICVLGIAYPGIAAEKVVELKFSTAVPATSHWHIGADAFVKMIEERTGGRYKIRIFSSDELLGRQPGRRYPDAAAGVHGPPYARRAPLVELQPQDSDPRFPLPPFEHRRGRCRYGGQGRRGDQGTRLAVTSSSGISFRRRRFHIPRS